MLVPARTFLGITVMVGVGFVLEQVAMARLGFVLARRRAVDWLRFSGETSAEDWVRFSGDPGAIRPDGRDWVRFDEACLTWSRRIWLRFSRCPLPVFLHPPL